MMRLFSVVVAGFVVVGGYDVILNLGNQNGDLAAGNARHHDKLPDPFDYLP